MDAKKAATVIENHQAWRRGGDGPQTDPVILGQALDHVIAALKAQGPRPTFKESAEPDFYGVMVFDELGEKASHLFTEEADAAAAVRANTRSGGLHLQGDDLIPLYTAPQPAQPQTYEIQCRPVVVHDCEDATLVFLVVGNQQFEIGEYHETKDDAAAFAGFLRAALNSIAQPAQPKRLEWVRESAKILVAETPFGPYCVINTGTSYETYNQPLEWEPTIGYVTEEQAQAAAQANFDKRSRECFQ